MTLEFSIDPEAAEELSASIAWYEQGRTGRADEFEAAFTALVARLLEWPESGSKHEVQFDDVVVRHSKIAKSPYWIVYYVVDRTLNVVAIAHERRKPGYWKYRASR